MFIKIIYNLYGYVPSTPSFLSFKACEKYVSDPDLDWKEACIEREEHHELWKNSGENMTMYHIKDAHFGSVNVVHLVEVCI